MRIGRVGFLALKSRKKLLHSPQKFHPNETTPSVRDVVRRQPMSGKFPFVKNLLTPIGMVSFDSSVAGLKLLVAPNIRVCRFMMARHAR